MRPPPFSWWAAAPESQASAAYRTRRWDLWGRYSARSSPPSRADTPQTQSTVRRCGSSTYSAPHPSAFSHRQEREWRRRRAISSCRTRSGWRECPRMCSRTPAAEGRMQAQAMPCSSGNCIPPVWRASPAKCAGKLRSPPSRTLTHKRRAAWYRTAADTASSRVRREQSSRRSTATGNTPACGFCGRRCPKAARQRTRSVIAAGSQSAP